MFKQAKKAKQIIGGGVLILDNFAHINANYFCNPLQWVIHFPLRDYAEVSAQSDIKWDQMEKKNIWNLITLFKTPNS